MQPKIVLSSSLLFLLALNNPDVFADDAIINEAIKSHEINIAQLKQNAIIVGVLAVAIAIFGGISTILQGLKTGWIKPATIFLCISIVAATSVKDYYYEDSRKGFLANANKATKILNTVKVKMSLHDEEEKTQQFYLDIIDELSTIDAITANQITFSSVDEFNFIKPAFADSEPPWFTQENYEDDVGVYFVGRAESNDYNSAENLAGKEAYKKVLAHYLEQVKTQNTSIDNISTSALAGTAKRTAELIDSRAEKVSGKFKYTLVLKLNKKSRDFALKMLNSSTFKKAITEPSADSKDVKELVDAIIIEQPQTMQIYRSQSFKRY